MSKFKKGDWLRRDDDVRPGTSIVHIGWRIYDVLPGRQYVVEIEPEVFRVYEESYFEGDVLEPRCTGWDWVLPEPFCRFGLKVGDSVVIKTWDGHEHRDSQGEECVIESIDDSFSDGIARFRLVGKRLTCWHPYWFGLCQSDGSPLPPKPETYKMYEYVGMRSIPGDGGYVELLHHPDLKRSPSSGRPIVPTGRVFEIPKEEKP